LANPSENRYQYDLTVLISYYCGKVFLSNTVAKDTELGLILGLNKGHQAPRRRVQEVLREIPRLALV
jgi:hypothetical protein